eukprot:s2642_g9.t1
MAALGMYQQVSDIKTLDQGPLFLYVLQLPEFPVDGQLVESKEVFVIPVLSRKDGILLALPREALPESLIASSVLLPEDSLLGPSTVVSVPLVMEDTNGGELQLGADAEVILADFHGKVVLRMRDFDPVTEGPPAIMHFYGEDIDMYPSAAHLLDQSLRWIESMADDRLAFYSAEDEPPVSPPKPKTAAAGKAKAKAATKKVTTATLSEQLSSLAQALPAISSQLASLQGRQDKMEALLTSPALASKRQPHRMDFERPPQAVPPMGPAQFMRAIGPSPKVKPAPTQTDPLQQMAEDEPYHLPEEGEELQFPGDPITQSLLVQQKALTTLVAHLTQDGLQDFGGATSSSSLSLKGSAKREKLLAEFATRKGNFLLRVAQNAFRRLKPTEPLPSDLASFQGKAIFTKYLERQGGFGGAQRDLGLVMWLLSTIGDLMVAGDNVGAQEMLALTLVAVEQTAQDGGKWEVGWLLSLQEDPPSGVFAHKPVTTNPRLRAFSPLCPPEWATTALAFVKEADVINSRRQEALPAKKQPGGNPKEEGEGPKKPKNPRYAKKPKEEETK